MLFGIFLENACAHVSNNILLELPQLMYFWTSEKCQFIFYAFIEEYVGVERKNVRKDFLFNVKKY